MYKKDFENKTRSYSRDVPVIKKSVNECKSQQTLLTHKAVITMVIIISFLFNYYFNPKMMLGRRELLVWFMHFYFPPGEQRLEFAADYYKDYVLWYQMRLLFKVLSKYKHKNKGLYYCLHLYYNVGNNLTISIPYNTMIIYWLF